VFTSVAAVDGADVITAVLPDGTRQPVTGMFGANRQQDWVVLAGGPAGEVAHTIASQASTQVGDRLFSLAGSSPTSRVLVDGAIAGMAGGPASRLLMTLSAVPVPPGGPVFNEFGELVGIAGGSLVPGASDELDLLRFRAELNGIPVVPTTAIRAPLEPLLPLAEARTRGDFLAAVQRGQHVLSGGFARAINNATTVTASDQRREFSTRDKTIVVFVTWSPQARLKGAVVMRLFDETNRVIVDSKPGKLNLRVGDSRLSSWSIPVPLRPGVFRADVSIDGVPIWRDFVRITE
jgi:hypothetical protein